MAVDGFVVDGTPAPPGSIAYRWGSIRRPGASGGAEAVAGEQGASLTLPFRGTSIRWITVKRRVGGRANVFLDGHLVYTYDGYSPTPREQPLIVLGAPGVIVRLKVIGALVGVPP